MRYKWVLVILFFTLLACSLPQLSSQVVSTPTPETANRTPVPATPSPPPATPTLTPVVVSPTIEPTEIDPNCVEPQPGGFLAGSDFEGYPQAVLDFLNNSGSWQALDTALYDAGVANQPTAVAATDFNGDGKNDIAVSIFNPESQSIPPEGRLMLYMCREGQFEIAYNQPTGEQMGGPHLWYWQDLNDRDGAELVVSDASCGAHTCFEQLQILSWTGNEFENRLQGSTRDLPYPDVRITDPDEDGVYQLEVTGAGFGSVGAGPQRSETIIWKYNADTRQWEMAETALGPSNFRIHTLHDADAAAQRGDLEAALVLYERVVTDTSLEDWMDPETERANLGAYARYKMVAVYTFLGREQFAQAKLAEMREAYPENLAQHGYLEMAEIFRETFATEGLESACAAVADFASSNPESVLEPLGGIHFGYANPDYAPQDMCPVSLER